VSLSTAPGSAVLVASFRLSLSGGIVVSFRLVCTLDTVAVVADRVGRHRNPGDEQVVAVASFNPLCHRLAADGTRLAVVRIVDDPTVNLPVPAERAG
jgi:hypothetical protein